MRFFVFFFFLTYKDTLKMINLRIRECYLFRTLYWIFLKISLYVTLGYFIK